MKVFRVEWRLELREGHFDFKILSYRLSKLSRFLYRFQRKTGKSFTILSYTLREIQKKQKKLIELRQKNMFKFFHASISMLHSPHFPNKHPSEVLTLAS